MLTYLIFVGIMAVSLPAGKCGVQCLSTPKKGKIMKTKAVIISCLMAAAIVALNYQHSWAESQQQPSSFKIGVVNIERVFQECKRNARYVEQSRAEQQKIISELEKISKEIDAEKAGLKTLKPGSPDYVELMKQMFQKQASLQAQQEFHKQHMTLKDQKWTEQLYEDILDTVEQAAKQKKLDLVLTKDQISLPAQSATELMMTIRTHKILYSAGCINITGEIIAKLDAKE